VTPPIELAAPPARHWRLRAEANGPGLADPALDARVGWPQVAAVFVARGTRPLQLAIGHERSVSDALALPALIPGYEPGAEAKLPQATLAPLVAQAPASAGLRERLADATPEDRRRWLLWGVLCAAVIGLAWLARGLWKDVAGTPDRAAPPS